MLSKELQVPVVILCQLRRPGDGKETHPRLSSMKESGDLEQNADNVWGLYRATRESEEMELEALKGRDTGTWKAFFRFNRFIQQFYVTTDPAK